MNMMVLLASCCLSGEVSQVNAPPPTDASPPAKRYHEVPTQLPPQRELSTISGCQGVDVIGEFLYWKPYEGGTEFAIQHPLTSTYLSPPSIFVDATSKSMQFSYDPGFRVGLVWHMPYDHWKMTGSYTFLHARSHTLIEGKLFPQFLMQTSVIDPPNAILNATSATARWHLHYQVLDVSIGREQQFCKSLLWVPYFGAKGALVHQKFRFDYVSGEEDAFSGETSTVRAKNDFDGVGMMGGVKADWVLGKGFRFLAHTSGALLWGRFATNNIQPLEGVSLEGTFHELIPTMTWMGGFAWGHKWRCGYVQLSVGWEMQYWWRQNQLPQFIDSSIGTYQRVSEDLMLQGGIASAQVSF
jgi:hypothetical protein